MLNNAIDKTIIAPLIVVALLFFLQNKRPTGHTAYLINSSNQ